VQTGLIISTLLCPGRPLGFCDQAGGCAVAGEEMEEEVFSMEIEVSLVEAVKATDGWPD
jgi:hypothetical protein